jgi:hypothetical protein
MVVPRLTPGEQPLEGNGDTPPCMASRRTRTFEIPRTSFSWNGYTPFARERLYITGKSPVCIIELSQNQITEVSNCRNRINLAFKVGFVFLKVFKSF